MYESLTTKLLKKKKNKGGENNMADIRVVNKMKFSEEKKNVFTLKTDSLEIFWFLTFFFYRKHGIYSKISEK